MLEKGDLHSNRPTLHIFLQDTCRSKTTIMKSKACQKFAIIQACVTVALIASANSSPNWPTPEFFEHHYHDVAPLPSELTSNSGPNTVTNSKTLNTGSTSSAPAVAVQHKESDTKSLRPRWANHQRLSAREAVAVMEEELQRREAAKAINTPIKNFDEIQPAASNTDSITASSNRRSGHQMGVTGPVHTFVKTDKHGHYKWGVRHHAGHGFS